MADFIIKQSTADMSNFVEIGSQEDIIDQFKQELIDEFEKRGLPYTGLATNITIREAIEIIKSK